jgi:hypothetical protein
VIALKNFPCCLLKSRGVAFAGSAYESMCRRSTCPPDGVDILGWEHEYRSVRGALPSHHPKRLNHVYQCFPSGVPSSAEETFHQSSTNFRNATSSRMGHTPFRLHGTTKRQLISQKFGSLGSLRGSYLSPWQPSGRRLKNASALRRLPNL